MTKFYMDKKRAIAAGILAFVVLVSILAYLSDNNLSGEVTGRAIIRQDGSADRNNQAEASQEQQECSNGCNPSNIAQVCSNGKWSECSSGKVCSLGQCVTPEKANRIIVRSSGGGGGGGVAGSSGGGSTVTTASGATYELGTIEIEKSFELVKNDRAKFTIGNEGYSLSLQDNSATEATITIDSTTYTVKLSSTEQIDLNSDGTPEFSVKLKSINIISNKATFVITV